MSTFIRKFAKLLDQFSEESAPVDTDGAPPPVGEHEKVAKELLALLKNPPIVASDLPAVIDAIKGSFLGTGIDDRKLLLEDMIQVMSNGKDFKFSDELQHIVISLLYKDLPHPPSGYVALPKSTISPKTITLPETTTLPPNPKPVNYAFRSADGSDYNPLMPTIGMAGSPYARSVPSTNNSPKTALPDPGLVFDTLLKRDGFKQHPGGISALFFAFADLVIHSIFNTDRKNPRINNSSSYLDLSVLYGNSEKEVETIRFKDGEGKKDGSGRLYEDVFADSRLLIMPPASCALLILLNRNHNFIAQRILDINENGTYKKTFDNTKEDEQLKNDQDDEIFNRARLVNCGYFMNIILGDYVGAILGLARDQSDWRLDPLTPIRGLDHSFTPLGEGNVVSIEFNLLYRWHSTLSAQDTEWFENSIFKTAFPDVKPADLTPTHFKEVAHTVLKEAGTDPRKWTFNKLTRNGDGRFKDGDLATILQNATSWYAGAFRARGIPETLRVVEIMAIEQSRTWGTCSLNEFRKFLGLKPYATFADWNPDPLVHTAASALYKNIDNLELHVGLQAEEAKSPRPGAGLCPGYTISRAILADAVCLTRGDRFMTVDFTPHNLTAWGYQDCQYDKQDGSFGGMLTKLLFRTLPNYYPKGSAYAHFPFLQPEYMKEVLTSPKSPTANPELAAKYTWTRPVPRLEPANVYTYRDVKAVLDDGARYVAAYDNQAFEAVKPCYPKKAPTVAVAYSSVAKRFSKNFEAKFADAEAAEIREARAKFIASKKILAKAVFERPVSETANTFKATTQRLIKDKTFKSIGTSDCYVDIIRDVINLVPIHWVSQEVAGFPLKTKETSEEIWYESVTYDNFADIAEYIYLDFEPVNDWRLRESSQANAKEYIDSIKENLNKIRSSHYYPFLNKLWTDHGKGSHHAEFAASLFAAVVPTAPIYSQAVSHIVNFYLQDERQAQREEIVVLSKSKDKDADAKIMRYAYEALRLKPITAGVYRTATKGEVIANNEVAGGQTIFTSIVDANIDTTVFGPDALTANFDSTTKSTIVGYDHGFLTPSFFDATVPAVLGVIFNLQGLKKGPKRSGELLSFTEDFQHTKRELYPSQRGLVTPWPESLVLEYTATA